MASVRLAALVCLDYHELRRRADLDRTRVLAEPILGFSAVSVRDVVYVAAVDGSRYQGLQYTLGAVARARRPS